MKANSVSADFIYETYAKNLDNLPEPPEAPLERAIQWLIAPTPKKTLTKDQAVKLFSICAEKYFRGQESMVRDLNVGGSRTESIENQLRDVVDLNNPGEKDLEKKKVVSWGGRVSTRDQSKDNLLLAIMQKNLDEPSEEFQRCGFVSAEWFNRWVVEARLDGDEEEVTVVCTPLEVKQFFQKYPDFLHRRLVVYESRKLDNGGFYRNVKEEPKDNAALSSVWQSDDVVNLIKVEEETMPFDFQEHVIKSEYSAAGDCPEEEKEKIRLWHSTS